jgi:hypothetical protein
MSDTRAPLLPSGSGSDSPPPATGELRSAAEAKLHELEAEHLLDQKKAEEELADGFTIVGKEELEEAPADFGVNSLFFRRLHVLINAGCCGGRHRCLACNCTRTHKHTSTSHAHTSHRAPPYRCLTAVVRVLLRCPCGAMTFRFVCDLQGSFLRLF